MCALGGGREGGQGAATHRAIAEGVKAVVLPTLAAAFAGRTEAIGGAVVLVSFRQPCSQAAVARDALAGFPATAGTQGNISVPRLPVSRYLFWNCGALAGLSGAQIQLTEFLEHVDPMVRLGAQK